MSPEIHIIKPKLTTHSSLYQTDEHQIVILLLPCLLPASPTSKNKCKARMKDNTSTLDGLKKQVGSHYKSTQHGLQFKLLSFLSGVTLIPLRWREEVGNVTEEPNLQTIQHGIQALNFCFYIWGRFQEAGGCLTMRTYVLNYKEAPLPSPPCIW